MLSCGQQVHIGPWETIGYMNSAMLGECDQVGQDAADFCGQCHTLARSPGGTDLLVLQRAGEALGVPHNHLRKIAQDVAALRVELARHIVY